jgi:signal transduction histidine kinase
LGLAVSYGIVQEHAGTIEVKSENGAGTIFRIEFPIAENRLQRAVS